MNTYLTRQERLTTGGDDPILPKLLAAIRQSTEIEIAVAFIKVSGLQLIFDALLEAVVERAAKLRILTSDYMGVTDPQSLRMLLLLAERGAELKVFSAQEQSFHLKSYIFLHGENANAMGWAFIGSSNISRPALTDGLEWNFRVDLHGLEGAETLHFREIKTKFEHIFNDVRSRVVDHAWVESYEQRRKVFPIRVAPGSDEPEPPPPEPTFVQSEALDALAATRDEGFRRGLVVMATGLGKTFLAAFDSLQMGAGRVLFVAHREEILLQAEAAFLRVRPQARVGQYTGEAKDRNVDLLFASIQTLGRAEHLGKFDRQGFDYVVIDEFHHAAARSYRQLLLHFEPKFLLGLTATPDRTDQSDILSLCDDNLVYSCRLFDGVEQGLLSPFSYFGIADETVDYTEIAWRNGKFDPDALSSKLATLGRARHAIRVWKEKHQSRTLAFCVSRSHAEFMAREFEKQGVAAVACHSDSSVTRGEALERLAQGQIEIVFSVDLFNEGVDLPSIDTVMMLRPTESKILFLQQLGRGLRRAEGKERLVVLDFIGNHKAFLNRPQALFNVASNYAGLAQFAREVEAGQLTLPPGCFVNYDLQILDFLKQLDSNGPTREYQALRETLGRRPTAAEFYRAGASLTAMRQQHGSWWQFVAAQGDCNSAQSEALDQASALLREVEITAMNKCFKMILLEAWLELDGLSHPPTVELLTERSRDVFARRPRFTSDLPKNLRDRDASPTTEWRAYWKRNPINAWTGGNRSAAERSHFQLDEGRFAIQQSIPSNLAACVGDMLQELVDLRLASYEPRLPESQDRGTRLPEIKTEAANELMYFPDLRIACGHFRTSRSDDYEIRTLGPGYGRLDPGRHFVARASGSSMDGGNRPIRDGDYLLLERIDTTHAGSITGSVVAVERQNVASDDEYVLREVRKDANGQYWLHAFNPDYVSFPASDDMHSFARFKAIIDPLDMAVGAEFMREDIPALFGEAFNPGNWNSGHVVLKNPERHILLVTLNKQGKAEEHRYHDYFIDDNRFHWQSQNSTTPSGARGKAIIEHQNRGIPIYLFVRERKLQGKKAAPFRSYGQVRYLRHQGSNPMSVEFAIDTPEGS